ncbi:hypothetical protein HZH68_007510 [Vespula germanica]|uniref:Uncharacterized protein n=1 Tax=Vespula germanica TaxID=30212 RepID=A0A834NAC5_VESGE|nr:hypothetical protein HZH68_007510 [Vespula germanica]
MTKRYGNVSYIQEACFKALGSVTSSRTCAPLRTNFGRLVMGDSQLCNLKRKVWLKPIRVLRRLSERPRAQGTKYREKKGEGELKTWEYPFQCSLSAIKSDPIQLVSGVSERTHGFTVKQRKTNGLGREWTSEQDGYRELIVSWSIFIDWTANPADVSYFRVEEVERVWIGAEQVNLHEELSSTSSGRIARVFQFS